EGCILKGQGNNLMYPNVYSRMSGDIDVWVRKDGLLVGGYGLLMGKKSVEREVIRYVKERNPKARALYHHIDYGDFEDIEVEMHYRPSFMFNPVHNGRLQKWFQDHAEQQFKHMVELPDGVGMIAVPDVEFNIVFQLSHIYNHVLHEGIGLRQMIDYFFLLRSENLGKSVEGLELKDRDYEETLRHLGLWKIAGAVMWVLHEVLGLEEQYLIASMDERLGKVLLSEIMQGGNFGQYDEQNIRANNPIKKNWQRIRRDFRLMRYFPSECLWEPAFRLYHFFWRTFMRV
ncbi:MAG: nucleotidyltransferase family protein, partial [Bacteroidaceae bacterium]|nr:nucleotidyltransferase family protein [Bacteroidaceae bacterium]